MTVLFSLCYCMRFLKPIKKIRTRIVTVITQSWPVSWLDKHFFFLWDEAVRQSINIRVFIFQYLSAEAVRRLPSRWFRGLRHLPKTGLVWDPSTSSLRLKQCNNSLHQTSETVNQTPLQQKMSKHSFVRRLVLFFIFIMCKLLTNANHTR